jgi:phosphatidylglycerophosphate synthase
VLPQPAYIAKAAIVFGAILVIALSRVRAYHPHQRFGAANAVTALRAALVAIAAGAVGESHSSRVLAAAIVASAAAAALDGLDGWLARRLRIESAFGARFDLEVDALLILVLSILAWRYHKAGAWVLASGLTRYLFVAAGALWPWLRRPLPGTTRGKAICILQIVALILVLVPQIRPPASSAIAAGSLAALWYSFFVDIRTLWQRR